MKPTLPALASLAPFVLTAVAVADEAARTIPPDNDFAPGLLLGVLLVVAALLVLIGIGIVIGVACVAGAGAFVALGIVSSSALIAIVRRRLSVGLLALHYQISAVIGLPCGIGVLWLGTALADVHLRHRDILLIGSAVGIIAGIGMAFILERSVRFLYHRLVSTSGSPVPV